LNPENNSENRYFVVTNSPLMDNSNIFDSLTRLREANRIYTQVAKLSKKYFLSAEVGDTSAFLREAELLLKVMQDTGTDMVIGIFNHQTYTTELEVGHETFWGFPSNDPKPELMRKVLSLLEKGYESFPAESVAWLASILKEIPLLKRINLKFHHCGIRYRRKDGKPLCLFSQGAPLHYDEAHNFSYTFNFVQNVAHLMKKDFPHYWIRLSYGEQQDQLSTFHSNNKETSNRDLLSTREKEILQLIAEDLDTKEIANRLFISPNTVGNHRSNMIERLGARDTTALVQLAKMTGMI
jgi:DNA-binding CsgD family transcriptional regulator